MRIIISAIVLMGLAALGALLFQTAARIREQSTLDEARPADLILVLGAAEYRGRPSPVFRARLDHGFGLWRKKLAPRILTAGGSGGDPDFTEGGVGRAYLISRGVPSEAIIVEPEGETTMQSTAAAAEIMRRMGLTSCIVVSDGYHIFRAKKMLERQGIQVYGSPWSTVSHDDRSQWWLYLRQACGYLLWSAGIRI